MVVVLLEVGVCVFDGGRISSLEGFFCNVQRTQLTNDDTRYTEKHEGSCN